MIGTRDENEEKLTPFQRGAYRAADILLAGTAAPRWPVGPPDVRALDDTAYRDPAFDTALHALMKDPSREHMDVAVIDFSPLAANRPFEIATWKPRRADLSAAWQDPKIPERALPSPDRTTLIASLGKVAILYAAFQLRDDVRRVAVAGAKTVPDLIKALRAYWRSTGARHLASIAGRTDVARLDKAPARSRRAAAGSAAARCESSNPFPLFDLTQLGTIDPLKIDFVGGSYCGVDALNVDVGTKPDTARAIGCIDALDHGSASVSKWRAIEKLTFAERLWMTIAWSDNVAASTCIGDIGLPYLQALLLDSKLFDRSTRQGLWLKRSYYSAPPAEHGTRFGKISGAFPVGGGVNAQAGSTRALGALMIALQRRELISKEPSREMIRYLRPLGPPASPWGVTPPPGLPGLLQNGQPLQLKNVVGRHILNALGLQDKEKDSFMKAGLYRTSKTITTVAADWAFIEATSGTGKLGVVVLGTHGFSELENLTKAIASTFSPRLI